ncbi:hypothetical protein [Streptomyces gobiensis]|uniref:hypothetical protein n=1 Tax=Streptomyces gobiensis TaxID=2875706 RepID=UPI001E2B3BA1|nr:hypothetical protein [Streptomyces gobiensis]UGY93562.1 hypothetical protein test1122_18780 [Streptomyces gobiensis]
MSTETSAAAGPAETARPTRVTVAAALVGLQGIVVAGLGVWMLALLLTGDRPDSVTQAATGAVTVLALAVLPLAAARGLWRLRRWSRSPAIFLQLLSLPVGWQMGNSEGAWVAGGLALAAVAIAVLVCLFHRKAADSLGIAGRDA